MATARANDVIDLTGDDSGDEAPVSKKRLRPNNAAAGPSRHEAANPSPLALAWHKDQALLQVSWMAWAGR